LGLVWSGLVLGKFCWTGRSGGIWRISAYKGTNEQTNDKQPNNQANIEPIQISCWTGKNLEFWRLAIIVYLRRGKD
jgi:hypothetical protein